MTLTECKNKYQKLLSKKEIFEESIKQDNTKLKRLKKREIAIEKVRAIIQEVAKRTQENLKIHIEDIVQMGLDICFSDITFVLDFEVKRGKTEAGIYFEQNGYKMKPFDSYGGGVLDIASFALRVACWSLGNTNNTIILDEPIKNLDVENMPKAIELLKQLSEKLGIQFIIVTHNEMIAEIANTVYKVVKNGEVSEARRM